jgi:taurine dioxygenase
MHPETGRKALYISPSHTVRFLDMDIAESDALIAEQCEHTTRSDLVYRHQWQPHDLVW